MRGLCSNLVGIEQVSQKEATESGDGRDLELGRAEHALGNLEIIEIIEQLFGWHGTTSTGAGMSTKVLVKVVKS
jgi:hypothetical protein